MMIGYTKSYPYYDEPGGDTAIRYTCDECGYTLIVRADSDPHPPDMLALMFHWARHQTEAVL